MTGEAALRVGLIGCGRIGRPVADFLAGTDGFELAGILVRRPTSQAGRLPVTADPDRFFGLVCDLYVDAAGPQALAAYGARAPSLAPLWTIGAAALADDDLRARFEGVGRRSGHRLRVLSGALAGLDGAAAAAAGGGLVSLSVTRPGSGVAFAGSAREAARAHPDEANVAVAAALTCAGLDATRISLHDAASPARHRLDLVADAPFGRVSAEVALNPPADGLLHPVAASIIAALKRERQIIQVG